MPRPFYILKANIRKSLVALATSALILPSLSPAFAGDRYSRGYEMECNSNFGRCVTPKQQQRHYHRHGNQQPHYHRHNAHRQHSHQPRHQQPRVVQRRSKDNTGKWVVAGIIGLAAGAIILGEAQKRKQRAAQTQPKRVHAGHGDNFQPWSPGWYRWCAQRYRSFNPRTGTYRGYDGYDHFCVVK